MAEPGARAPAFAVETVQIDLPALVGALGRRLREAGLPVTPARSAELARALDLVRPVARRRLYWTARAPKTASNAGTCAWSETITARAVQ